MVDGGWTCGDIEPALPGAATTNAAFGYTTS
jgi:hypothetical protein